MHRYTRNQISNRTQAYSCGEISNLVGGCRASHSESESVADDSNSAQLLTHRPGFEVVEFVGRWEKYAGVCGYSDAHSGSVGGC